MDVYVTSSANIYLFIDDMHLYSLPVYYDKTIFRKVISHEIGHALGWYGHSNFTSMLMHKYALQPKRTYIFRYPILSNYISQIRQSGKICKDIPKSLDWNIDQSKILLPINELSRYPI